MKANTTPRIVGDAEITRELRTHATLINRLASAPFSAYVATTAAKTLTSADRVVDCTSGSFTVTLPTAVGFMNDYIIKNSGTGVITVNTTSSQTIDGNLSIGLNQYDSVTVRSNNANWIIV
jgi:hypothetical protein